MTEQLGINSMIHIYYILKGNKSEKKKRGDHDLICSKET